jgi:hypothetical protein
MQIWRKDGPPVPDLVTSRPPAAGHQRDRHPRGVEVLATGKVDVAHAHGRVLIVEGLRDLHVHVGSVLLLLWRWAPGPDLTLGDPVRPPRAHDRKGPILYTFAYKYYCFGLIF